MDPLGVLEMAGRVVGDVELERRAWPGPAIGQQFGDVTNACAQPSGWLGPQQMPVVLEQRAASGAVHHHEVGLSARASRLAAASARAPARSPACSCSAPQQP